MSEEIKKYDKNNNLIYFKNSKGSEYWMGYDKNNNKIHNKTSYGFEEWAKYDENNNVIHSKYIDSYNCYNHWYKYDENNKQIGITEKEYKDIEFRKKEKEYLSRTKCSRFEIMDI